MKTSITKSLLTSLCQGEEINILRSPFLSLSSWLVQNLSLKKDYRQAGMTVRRNNRNDNVALVIGY
jgi:hypothetical protein